MQLSPWHAASTKKLDLTGATGRALCQLQQLLQCCMRARTLMLCRSSHSLLAASQPCNTALTTRLRLLGLGSQMHPGAIEAKPRTFNNAKSDSTFKVCKAHLQQQAALPDDVRGGVGGGAPLGARPQHPLRCRQQRHQPCSAVAPVHQPACATSVQISCCGLPSGFRSNALRMMLVCSAASTAAQRSNETIRTPLQGAMNIHSLARHCSDESNCWCLGEHQLQETQRTALSTASAFTYLQ